MIVVTNAGSNPHDEAAKKYGIEICPQGVLVNGKSIETLERVPFDVADSWVRSSPQHPHVLGTTAKEFASVFQRVAQTHREIIVVQGSKKLVQSFQAASSAAKMLREHPRYRDVRIEVIDTRVTDAGVGLIAVLAAVAGANGLDFATTVRLAHRAVERLTTIATVRDFDYLVRGGRASVFKARLAEFLRIRPLIGLNNGEVAPIGRISQNDDACEKMVDYLIPRVGERVAVWAAVAHGGDSQSAERLLELLRKRLKVEWGFVIPMSVTTYLNSGRGALAAAVLNIDGLDWRPPPPLTSE